MADDVPVTDLIRTEVDGGIARITLDRPDAGNSLTAATCATTSPTCSTSCRPRSACGPSCSPAPARSTSARAPGWAAPRSPSRPAPTDAPDRALGDVARMVRRGWQRLVASILDCEKPVVAAVNGTAAGGGANLVLACDLVVMADTARLIEVFVTRGIIPDAGGCLPAAADRRSPASQGDHVPRRRPLGGRLRALGHRQPGRARRRAPADGRRARRPPGLRPDQGDRHDEVAREPQLTRAAGHSAFEEEAYAQELVTATADMAEGIAAFSERRPPSFKGW